MISPEILLRAYAQGHFPMGMDDGRVDWFSPHERGVLPLDEFHLPHGLKRSLRRRPFSLRLNTAFDEVINGCARRLETWITPGIRRSYLHLHRLGFAHSVEAWDEGLLCGGLYGVGLNGAFFGESMFHRKTDASKIALYALVRLLSKHRFVLLDTQWRTPHLAQFGVRSIPRVTYLRLLQEALRVETIPLTEGEASLDWIYSPDKK